MNFKSIGLKAAIATAVVATSAVAMAPAQAFTFHKDSFLKFNVDKELKSVTSTGVKFSDNILFGDGSRGGSIKVSLDSNGTFAPYAGTQAFVKNFAYTLVGGKPQLSTPIDNFITLSALGKPTLTFDLTGFNDSFFTEAETLSSDLFGVFNASIQGFFEAPDGDTAPADPGSVVTAFKLANGTNNFTSSISVPTPALLPGLIGLGVGFVRKRKLAKQAVEA